MSAPQVETVFCRCDPLPPLVERLGRSWTCSGCGNERRYCEKISVGAGGVVDRCGGCRYEARRTGASVPLTLCRFLTETTLLAGELRESNTYYMCDSCCDAEIARYPKADLFDGRRKP